VVDIRFFFLSFHFFIRLSLNSGFPRVIEFFKLSLAAFENLEWVAQEVFNHPEALILLVFVAFGWLGFTFLGFLCVF